MVVTALLVGAIAGLVNGVLIAYGRMAPFIVTLAMMVAARGLAQKISGKTTQVVKVEDITNIAQNTLLGIPWLVLIFAAVAALAWVLLNRTTFGRRTAAIGGNREAARLAGISVRRTEVLIYVLSGLCCGIAAVMVTAQANAGSSDHGNLYELPGHRRRHHRRHRVYRRARHDRRLGAWRPGLHLNHQPLHRQQPCDRVPADRAGRDHRGRRPHPAVPSRHPAASQELSMTTARRGSHATTRHRTATSTKEDQ